MAEYSKIIRGNFTSTGVAKFLSLPMVPDTIEIWNTTKYGSAAAGSAISAIGFNDRPAGSFYSIDGPATTGLTSYVGASGGFTFIDAGTYQYGPVFTVTGIVAATGVVTTSAPHGYAVGDTVVLYGTTGMLQIAGVETTITAVPSTTTFTIGNIPTSTFAANATAGFVKKVLFADLYVPYINTITAITTGVTTTIATSINHSFVVGQEVFFTIPSTPYVNTTPVWGTTQLDSQTYLQANLVPQQAYIVSITNANTFVVSTNSTGYGAFTWPTSAEAAMGITFAQVAAIGDQNTGYMIGTPIPIQPTGVTYTNTLYPKAITIPGAFLPNTRKGVIVGTGDGTTILHVTSDIIEWRAIFPDMVQLNA